MLADPYGKAATHSYAENSSRATEQWAVFLDHVFITSDNLKSIFEASDKPNEVSKNRNSWKKMEYRKFEL
jgi:hypothetical protein